MAITNCGCTKPKPQEPPCGWDAPSKVAKPKACGRVSLEGGDYLYSEVEGPIQQSASGQAYVGPASDTVDSTYTSNTEFSSGKIPLAQKVTELTQACGFDQNGELVPTEVIKHGVQDGLEQLSDGETLLLSRRCKTGDVRFDILSPLPQSDIPDGEEIFIDGYRDIVDNSEGCSQSKRQFYKVRPTTLPDEGETVEDLGAGTFLPAMLFQNCEDGSINSSVYPFTPADEADLDPSDCILVWDIEEVTNCEGDLVTKKTPGFISLAKLLCKAEEGIVKYFLGCDGEGGLIKQDLCSVSDGAPAKYLGCDGEGNLVQGPITPDKFEVIEDDPSEDYIKYRHTTVDGEVLEFCARRCGCICDHLQVKLALARGACVVVGVNGAGGEEAEDLGGGLYSYDLNDTQDFTSPDSLMVCYKNPFDCPIQVVARDNIKFWRGYDGLDTVNQMNMAVDIIAGFNGETTVEAGLSDHRFTTSVASSPRFPVEWARTSTPGPIRTAMVSGAGSSSIILQPEETAKWKVHQAQIYLDNVTEPAIEIYHLFAAVDLDIYKNFCEA